LLLAHHVSSCPKLSCGYGKVEGGLEPIVRELMLLTALACVGLGLAWAHEADYFALVFAVEGALAGVEAVRLSQ
jgi:hypothetical protein